MTTRTVHDGRRRSTIRWSRFSGRPTDDGSLIMAILLAIMFAAMIMVATATVIAGLNKTQATRNFTVTQQMASAAVDEAVVHANYGTLPVDGDPQTCAATAPGSTCTWHITTDSAAVRTVTVTTTGYTDRTFEATLTRSWVHVIDPPGPTKYQYKVVGEFTVPAPQPLWQITSQVRPT